VRQCSRSFSSGIVREVSPAVDPNTGTVKVKIGLAETPPAMTLGRVLTVAVFATVVPMLSATGSAVAAGKFECYTDEGYGRYRPCNSLFKGAQTKN